MSRRHAAKKRLITPDHQYNSPLLHMLVNRVMKKGKKALAYKIVYKTLDQLKLKTDKDAFQVMDTALNNIRPNVEVKAKRVGGSAYQIPLTVTYERGTVLALQWLLIAARKRSGKSTIMKLTNEFLDAWNKTGGAVKKRNEVKKMADANKAFARFRFKK